MARAPGTAPSRVFYGWWVALALSTIVFLSAGIPAGIRFTLGPLLKPVSADLGLDRGSFSLVIALSLLLCGGFIPIVGRLVGRLGSRTVSINEAARPAGRAVRLPPRPHPVAGGR